MKRRNLIFLVIPVVIGLIALILGLKSESSMPRKETIVSLSLDKMKYIAYQNLREMATPDFQKLILDSTEGYSAFMDVIEYRNVTKHRSKQVLNKNLKNSDIYKLTEGELDLIQQFSMLDRTEAGWFEDKPSWAFAKKFVHTLIVLENGDHAAEFVLDESFGVEAGRIADVLNKKMTEAVRVTQRFGGMRAVKRVFKKVRSR